MTPVSAVILFLLPSPIQSSPALDQAALLYGKGRVEEALSRLESAGDGEAEAQLLKGLALRRLRREAEAARALGAAKRLDPGLADASLNLGLSLFHLGRWSEAQKEFEEAAAAWPLRPEARLGLGMVLARRRDFKGAQAAFEQALELDPRRAAGWMALSDSLLELGRAREAAEARDKARKLLKSADPEFEFKQAALWYGLGDLPRASKAFEASDPGDHPEAYLLKGSLLYRQGELEEAEEYFLAAIKARPAYLEARLNLGIARYAREDYAGAMQAFQEILKLKARHTQAQSYLKAAQDMAVDFRLRQGSQAVLAQDSPRAIAAWEQARALSKGREKEQLGRMIASLRSELGPQAAQLASAAGAAFEQGKLERALDLWGQALSLDPKCEAALQGLKAAEAQAGALKAARARMESERQARLKALEEASAQALAAERFAAAQAALDEALRLAPRDPRLLNLRRQARSGMRKALASRLALAAEMEAAGRPAEALKAAQAALDLDPDDLEAGQLVAKFSDQLQVRRADPGKVKQWYYEGVYLYGAGKTAQALALWKRALQAAPSDALLNQAVRAATVKLETLAEFEGGR